AEDGIRCLIVTGVQTCALPISRVIGLQCSQKPVLRKIRVVSKGVLELLFKDCFETIGIVRAGLKQSIECHQQRLQIPIHRESGPKCLLRNASASSADIVGWAISHECRSWAMRPLTTATAR